MTGEPNITIIGNLTGDPELRFTPNGAAVANFTIASTPRNFDRASGEWKEGETLFMRCSIWREAAENVANSLRKGMRVIAEGKLIARSWEDKNGGGKRTSMELEVEEIGPSLRFASASVNRNQRNNGGNYGGGEYRNSSGQTTAQMEQAATSQLRANPNHQPKSDPWAAQANGKYDWGASANSDEAPF